MGNDGRQAGRVRVKSFDRRSGPPVGLLGAAFVVGGVATAGLGIAVTALPHAHPLLSEASWVLGRLGLSGPALLAPGAALVAGGALVLALRGISRLIGVDRETAEAIDDLTRASTNQASAISVLESLVAALRQETAEAAVLLRDQVARHAQRDENDPLFRLAASLDQLGARMERTVQSARDGVLDAVHALHDHVEGTPTFDSTPLVDSAVRVERCMDDLVGRLGALERELADALRPVASEPRASLHDGGFAERAAEAAYPDDAGEPAAWRGAPQAYAAPYAGAFGQAADSGALEHDRYADAPDAAAESGPDAEHDEPLVWTTDGHTPLRLRLEPPAPLPSPRFVGLEDEDAPALGIEDELDRAIVDASDDDVPPPLPSKRPEGLDLLTRLDSARPLDVVAHEAAPPLFPDLDWDRR